MSIAPGRVRRPMAGDLAAGLGLGLRVLPAVWHLPIQARAVTTAMQARERNDLSGGPVRVLDAATAGSAKEVEAEALSRALALRLRHTGRDALPRRDAHLAVAVADDVDQAALHATVSVISLAWPALRRAADRRAFAPDGSLRDWAAESTALLAALDALGARVHLSITPWADLVCMAEAEVTLPGAGNWKATAGGLDPASAGQGALWAAMRVLVLGSLTPAPPTPPSSERARGGQTAPRAAHDGARGHGRHLLPEHGHALADLLASRALELDLAVVLESDLVGVSATVRPVEKAAALALGRHPTRESDPPPGWLAPPQVNLAVDAAHTVLSRLYHENSKIHESFRDLPALDLTSMTPSVRRVLTRPVRRGAPGAPAHPLPRGDHDLVLLSLHECLRRRRSAAEMSQRALTTRELGHLLHLAAGVTATGGTPDPGIRIPLRAAPTSGGLGSTDVYVYARGVEGLKRGIYYYDPLQHELRAVRHDVVDERFVRCIGYPPRVRDCAAVVFYVAAFRRLQWKYWERAYRMAHLDAGHLAENILLVATALGLVGHPMVAFVDDAVDHLLGVDGQDEATLYLTLLGAAADRPQPSAGTPAAGDDVPEGEA